MSYASASDVALFCTNLTSGSPNFWESSKPPQYAVEDWLSAGCAIIHARLSAAGYSTPVAEGTAPAVYGQVKQLETFYGVAMAELSRLSGRVTSKERTRDQVFMDMFNDGLDRLVSQDLALAGHSVSGTAPIHVGGISKARKEAVQEDSDLVEPRFYREQFRFPGTVSEYSSGS